MRPEITSTALEPAHATPQWRHVVAAKVGGAGRPLASSSTPQRAAVVVAALTRWVNDDPEGFAAAVDEAVAAERAHGTQPSNADVRLTPHTAQAALDAMRPIIQKVRDQAREGYPAPGYTAPEAWTGYYEGIGRRLLDAALPPVQQQWLPGTTTPDLG